MQPILDGEADVVYGSRFLDGRPPGPWLSVAANRGLTGLTNVLFGGRLTDMETCYKIMKAPVARGLAARVEPVRHRAGDHGEAAASRRRIVERPVKFDPRNRASGKKIGWRDGFHAIAVLLKYRFRDRRAGVLEKNSRLLNS